MEKTLIGGGSGFLVTTVTSDDEVWGLKLG